MVPQPWGDDNSVTRSINTVFAKGVLQGHMKSLGMKLLKTFDDGLSSAMGCMCGKAFRKSYLGLRPWRH